MPIQTSYLLALAAVAASGLWTANDPFVGKWKLDASRSKYVDQMRVEAAGPNKYVFRFEGGGPEAIVANGTDQPGLSGTTLSAKSDDARSMRIVRKQGGRTIIDASWKLSADGRTLHDSFTQVGADGSRSTSELDYARTAGRSGFAGTWQNTSQQIPAFELQIQPYDAHGLSFVTPSANSVKNIPFDGKDHPIQGMAPGATASGRRLNARSLELTEKLGEKLLDRRSLKVSGDAKILTMTMRIAGQASPNVLVFERE